MFQFLVLFLLFFSVSLSQPYLKKFKRFGLKDGLSQGTINAIVQDKHGFMWFATQDGLNKYDGYHFTVYPHRLNDSTTLSSGFLTNLYVDNNILWITSTNGISKLNLKNNQIKRFISFRHKDSYLKNKQLNLFFIDRKRTHWAFGSGQIFKLDKSNNEFFCVKDSINTSFVLECEDKLYLGTDNGILKFDGRTWSYLNEFKGQTLQSYCKIDDDNFIVSIGKTLINHNFKTNTHTEIINLSKDFSRNTRIFDLKCYNSVLWIASSEGLILYDLKTKKIEKYQSKNYDNYTISNDYIISIYKDRSGTVWLGTRYGLNNYSKYREKFRHYKKDVQSKNSLIDNEVTALLKDSKENLWIGTATGVSIYRKKENIFVNNLRWLKSKTIRSFFLDTNSDVFVGTYEGLFIYNKEYNYKGRIILNHKEPGDLSNHIYSVVKHNNGEYWLGTYNGLFKAWKNGPTWKTQKLFDNPGSNQLSNNVIRVLEIYGQDTLLVGTRAGFNYINLKNQKAKQFLNNVNEETSISSNSVSDILVDSKQRIWIMTQSGINEFNIKENSFKRYHDNEGLTSKQIYGILEDNNGTFWMSSNSGLIKFKPNINTVDEHERNFEMQFERFTEDDGLQSNEFNQGSFYKAGDGELFFGGNNGYNRYYPEEIIKSDYSPNIIFTRFKRFNHIATLDSSFSDHKTLELNHNDYVFTVEFSAMDYNNSAAVSYMYKLDGFDKKTIDLHKKNEITYANLPSGNYTLKIYSSNSDGVWDIANHKELKLIIIPPLWLQNWFLILLVILTGLLLTAIYKWRLKKIKEHEEMLQNKVNEQTVELILVKNELLEINQIVHLINDETSVEGLLEALLKELTKIKPIERATAAIFNDEENAYYYRVSAGWDINSIKHVPLNREYLLKRYIRFGEEVKPELYLIKNFEKLSLKRDLKWVDEPKSMLSLVIREDKKIYGLLIFDNMRDKHAFDIESLRFLDALRDHIISAFYKVKLLDDLKRLHDIKNQFLGIAAHDLRNPLSMISGYASLNLEYLKLDKVKKEKLQNDLSLIVRTSDQMSALLTRLLDITSIESGKTTLNKEAFSLKALVSDISAFHERLAKNKNIEFTIDYESFEKIPKILLDRIRISEVIDNLLTNAIKYTKPGGSVRVEAEKIKNDVTVRVTDTGLGLNKEELKYVFTGTKKLSAKPTAGESSTGLGLAIVKKIIDLHGGTLDVKSEKGKGSVFSFSLPSNGHNSVNSDTLS